MQGAGRARFWGRVVAVWLAILLLAILNGALREAVLLPAWGRPAALVASGVLLAILILAAALASSRWIGAASTACAWRVGLAWLALTLAFEFTFGALVQGKTWPQLLAAYAMRDGNLWPLVLLVTLAAPVLARRLRVGAE